MVKTKPHTYLKRKWSADNKMPGGSTKEMKRQFSAYEAPSLKEFLLVLLAVGILVAFSWITYFKLGWFH